MLQNIKDNYKKKSWLRLCTLNNINKWELIAQLNESIYPGKYYINKVQPITTNKCLLCSTEFDLCIYKNSFFVKKRCDCGNNGKTDITANKLLCYYNKDIAEEIVKNILNERKKGLKNCIEYWISNGYNEEESLQKIKEIQKSRSSRSPSSQKGAKGYTNRSIEFWLKKGFSEEEAKLKLSESQTTNGLNFYIKKYGENIGKEKYNKRIEQWLLSPNNKKMSCGRSKISIELFNKIGFGFYGKDEKTLRGKQKTHRVDFLYQKKVIEFFGDYWHGNPKKYKNDCFIRKTKIQDIWEHDKNKIEDIKNNGYEVLIIWESDYIENPELILKLCKEFLNENKNTDS